MHLLLQRVELGRAVVYCHVLERALGRRLDEPPYSQNLALTVAPAKAASKRKRTKPPTRPQAEAPGSRCELCATYLASRGKRCSRGDTCPRIHIKSIEDETDVRPSVTARVTPEMKETYFSWLETKLADGKLRIRPAEHAPATAPTPEQAKPAQDGTTQPTGPASDADHPTETRQPEPMDTTPDEGKTSAPLADESRAGHALCALHHMLTAFGTTKIS